MSTSAPATAPSSNRTLPRVTRVDALLPKGCLFKVTNSSESFRVEKFGGEEQFTRLLLDELREGEVLLDIGACIGFAAVHAARKGCRVIAFEPDPAFRARLRENLRLNELNNVEVIAWAVSDTSGHATLYSDGVAGNSPSLACSGPQQRGRVEVTTDTIDRGLARGELPAPHVIKLDVEGAEARALRGMHDLLHSPAAPRAIFIEIHPTFLPAFGSTVEEVRSLLQSAGYTSDYDETRFDQIHRIYRLAH